jgi:hypothetical protein
MPSKWKNEDVYIQGKTKWFRPDKPDHQFPPPRWSHVIYPNAASLDIIRGLQARGLKNVLKKDDDGYYMTFSRKTERSVKGKLMGMQPPAVFEADGTTPFKGGLVGNGSDVTTKLQVYEHSTPSGNKAVAARWESTRIDHLIPYEAKRDFTEVEAQAAKGLDIQPPQF